MNDKGTYFLLTLSDSVIRSCWSITVCDIWIQRKWNMALQAFPPALIAVR